MRSFTAAVVTVFALGCGGEDVPPVPDETPPTSRALITVPTGSTFEVSGSFLANTVDVTIQLTADEVGARIYYTLDGTEPEVGERSTGVGTTPAILTLDRDVVVAFFAVDTAGNREVEVHRLEVSFDREGPILEVDPAPGVFGHAIEVTVSADVEATLYWTENDNRLPAPGTGYTKSAPLPVIFELARTTRLEVMARDEAGNRDDQSLRYVIDTEAPVTFADPPGGHFLGQLSVRLRADDEEADIVYTIDGSEPGAGSAVYSAPVPIEGDTELRFRGIDAGGNLEGVHVERYVVGNRGRRELGTGEDADRFPAEGALALGAALIDAAGPLSGRSEPAAHYGSVWDGWAAAVATIDAYTVQAGFGPHAMHSPGIGDVAAAGEGAADTSENGTNLDETWRVRVDALAARAGDEVPETFHPVSLFYVAATAQLLVRPTGELLADGRPDWTEDYRTLRWSGARSGDRQIHVGTTASALRALVSRAWTGTAGSHSQSEDAWSEAAPVLGLRCGGCHRPGAVAPKLSAPEDYGALVGGESPRLLSLLEGVEAHPGAPPPAAQVDAVRAWIEGGAGGAGEPRLGVTAREGFLGLHAIEQAGLTIAHALGATIYNPDTSQLGPLPDATGRHYVVGRGGVAEGPGPRGTPRRVDFIRVQDPEFRTGEQARLLRALAGLVELGQARPELFGEPPLSGSASLPGPSTLAIRLASQQLRALQLSYDEETGVHTEGKRPDRTKSRIVRAMDLADTALALVAADVIPGTNLREGALRAVAFADEHLADGAGTYAARTTLDGETDFSGRRSLEVQLALLEAMLVVGERESALRLWARLDALWWDAEAGAWQPELGIDEYVYTPALAARGVDALRAAVEAGLSEADARLDTFVRRVPIERMRLAETWTTGEVGTDEDADGDGVTKPRAAGGTNGTAPVFAREVRF